MLVMKAQPEGGRVVARWRAADGSARAVTITPPLCVHFGDDIRSACRALDPAASPATVASPVEDQTPPARARSCRVAIDEGSRLVLLTLETDQGAAVLGPLTVADALAASNAFRQAAIRAMPRTERPDTALFPRGGR